VIAAPVNRPPSPRPTHRALFLLPHSSLLLHSGRPAPIPSGCSTVPREEEKEERDGRRRRERSSRPEGHGGREEGGAPCGGPGMRHGLRSLRAEGEAPRMFTSCSSWFPLFSLLLSACLVRSSASFVLRCGVLFSTDA
jgi:hypothetical protein